MKHLLLLLASSAMLSLLDSPASAQHEPAVMVRSRLLCPGPVCRPDYQRFGQGNGVIIGRQEGSVTVLTVAHNLKGAMSTDIWIRSQWHTARVINVDPQADVALLTVPGQFGDIPVIQIASHDAPVGAELLTVAYWPGQQWRCMDLRFPRIRAAFVGVFAGRGRCVQGVSGGAILYQGELVGMVHGCPTDDPSMTLYVPVSVIRDRLSRWGYHQRSEQPAPQLAITDQLPAPPEVASDCSTPVPGLNTCDCGCPAKMAALERRLNLAVSQLTILTEQAQQDAESSGRDAASKIAALTEQISDIRSDLEQLTPLLERRVILVSEGKVTSERTLRPSDPIVLGSEVVIKKAANAD